MSNIGNLENALLLYYPTYGQLSGLEFDYDHPIDPVVSDSFERGGILVNDGYREASQVFLDTSIHVDTSPLQVIDFINWDTGVGELEFAEGHYFFNKSLVIYSRF